MSKIYTNAEGQIKRIKVLEKVTLGDMQIDGSDHSYAAFNRTPDVRAFLATACVDDHVLITGRIEQNKQNGQDQLIIESIRTYDADAVQIDQTETSTSDTHAEIDLDDIFSDFFEGTHDVTFGTKWERSETSADYEKRRAAAEKRHRDSWLEGKVECNICQNDHKRLPHIYRGRKKAGEASTLPQETKETLPTYF